MVANRTKTTVGIVLVIVVTIILHSIGWLKPIEGLMRRLVNAGSATLYTLTMNAASPAPTILISTSTSQIGSRISEDDYLTCLHGASEAAILADENKELRSQLGFFAKKTLPHIGAEVIGRDIEPIGNTIMINRGSTSGIQKGQAVIVSNGVLIGKIARAESDMAIVELINDGESKVAATIMNTDRSLGIVEGGYGLSVRMSFIPQNEQIAIGDSIVTSGLEPLIPRGLLIGTVEAVEKEAYQPFQRAVLTPMTSLDRLTIVSVILGSPSSTPL